MDPEQQSEKTSEPVIRTMRTDAAFYVREKKLSTLDIAAQTYAGQQSPFQISSQKSSVARMIFIIAVIVVFLGSVSFGIWWLWGKSAHLASGTPSELPQPVSLVRVDSEERISASSVNSGALVEQIKKTRSRSFSAGSLHRLIIVLSKTNNIETYSNAQEFAVRIGWAPPVDFEEIIVPNFTALVTTTKAGNDFAVVLQTTQFERALSMLLLWERTIGFDWRFVVPPLPDPKVAPVGFRDELIQNHDARVLVASDGTVYLAYAIFNKKRIIIATSREALSLVLERLIAFP